MMISERMILGERLSASNDFTGTKPINISKNDVQMGLESVVEDESDSQALTIQQMNDFRS